MQAVPWNGTVGIGTTAGADHLDEPHDDLRTQERQALDELYQLKCLVRIPPTPFAHATNLRVAQAGSRSRLGGTPIPLDDQ